MSWPQRYYAKQTRARSRKPIAWIDVINRGQSIVSFQMGEGGPRRSGKDEEDFQMSLVGTTLA